MEFRKDGTNIDIMAHNANEQMSNYRYREATRDIMTQNALLNPVDTRMFTCKTCGYLQRWRQCCDKCGALNKSF